MKREDEFVKRFWSVSDIFAGTVAMSWSFRGSVLLWIWRAGRHGQGLEELHKERGSGDGFDGLRLRARGSV